MTKQQEKNGFSAAINAHLEVFKGLGGLEKELETAITLCVNTLLCDKKVFVCGNGGSASDSQHLVGELIGRFTKDRKPLPAICLNTDTSVLTCISNDFSYDDVFARQLQGLGGEGDLLIVFSTSGLSTNIIKLCKTAKEKNIEIIGFLGKGGGLVALDCTCGIVIPSDSTAIIQECHIFLAHFLCGQIEQRLGLV